MKSVKDRIVQMAAVAPLVGAWIEIFAVSNHRLPVPVAPLVGAWIEIEKDCDRDD